MRAEMDLILALMLVLIFIALCLFRRLNVLVAEVNRIEETDDERLQKISAQIYSVGKLEREHFDMMIGEGRYIAQEVVLVVDALLKGEEGDRVTLPWLRIRS